MSKQLITLDRLKTFLNQLKEKFVATSTTLGGVKINGNGLEIESDKEKTDYGILKVLYGKTQNTSYSGADGKALEDIVNEIYNEIFPVTVRISSSPNIIEYKGLSEVYSTQISWDMLRKNISIIPDQTNVIVNDKNIQTTIIDSPTIKEKNYNINIGAHGTEIQNVLRKIYFNLTAKKDNKTMNTSTSAEIVLRMYFGFSDKEILTESDISKLLDGDSYNTGYVKSTPAGEYNIINPGTTISNYRYLWICIGCNKNIDISESAKKITSSGDFWLPMNEPISIGNYKCYRSPNKWESNNKVYIKIKD